MNKNFLEAICNFDNEVITTSDPRKAIVDSCSVPGYLHKNHLHAVDRMRPDAIHKTACALFSMDRGARRAYLARVSDSNRRLLIKEGTRIKQRIADCGIKYTPKLCWAIDAVQSGDTEGYKILDSLVAKKALPREVAAWYDSCIGNGVSARETRAQARKLGPYKLVGRLQRVSDDAAVDRFLAAGEREEAALENSVDEAIASASSLSEEAQERLDEVKKDLKTQAEDFIGAMVESVSEIIPDIVAKQTSTAAEEQAEDIVGDAPATSDDKQADGADEDANVDEVFGLAEDQVGDSVTVELTDKGDVQITTPTASVSADAGRVSATIDTPPSPAQDVAGAAPSDGTQAGEDDFFSAISETMFDNIEEHLSDSARAVYDSIKEDNPGVTARATATFRDWLKDNYTAMRDEPDSRAERLEKLLNVLHPIIIPTGIMLSVDDENLIYNGTESILRITNDGVEIGSLVYAYDNNPTASAALLRNAGNEFSIIIGSLEPALQDNGGTGADNVGDASDGLYDTIMANIDTLVGQLDEMGAPAKKEEKYMRPWFDRLSDGERAELKEAVAALPKPEVRDADDADILSDEAKEEVLKRVGEEVKRRLKENGIEISDDEVSKTWTRYIDAIGEGADHAEQLRKIREVLSEEQWERAIREFNKRMDHIGLGLPLDVSVDEIIEGENAEIFLHILATWMEDTDLARLYAAIEDGACDGNDDIQTDGEVDDIEDGVLSGGKKLLSKAKLKIGDKLQIGDKWATVVKKKFKTFLVKFENGIYKEYKYPEKMTSVPDQDNAAIMTEDSAGPVNEKYDVNEVRGKLNECLKKISSKRPDLSIQTIGDSMTLDEAIAHADEVSRSCEGEECMEEHRQLCEWLKELKALRGNAQLPEVHPDIHEGDRNTYDMSHNLETFSKVRNTREALEDILRAVTKALGLTEPLTAEQYQSGNVEERIIGAVSDSTFDMNQLDLICPKLYKRKFTDSAWMVDSIDDLTESFGVTIPDSFKGMPAVISSRPISDSVIAGVGGQKVITFPYDGNRCLYAVPFTE